MHYSASHEAPWLWYQPFDIGKVPAKGGHGTDMFKVHPELPGIIVDWFVTTLIKTPGSRAGGHRGICVGHQSNSDARRSCRSHKATD